RETGTVASYNDLAASYFRMAAIGVGTVGQLEYLKKAYDIWDTLSKAYPDVKMFRDHRDIAAKCLKQ
ncbi:MAG: hypothetical protein IJ046_00855, partial [Clostridia bacterium]|nr:hypothetical protein [Clostridia bacterium]